MVQDKVAVVTGASRGIGRSISLALAGQGAKIVAVDIDLAATEAFVEELKALGTEAVAVQGNVTVTEDVEAMFKSAVDAFGRVDILVNNAGITRDALLLRMKDEDWDAVLNVNLTASFRLARAALRPMVRARSGRIVSITSVVGVMGNPGQANYAASKAGMIGMSKALAQEVAPRGVTVNCVAPGFIETPMTDVLDDVQKQRILQNVPMGRLGHSEEVAAAVLFLVSDEAGYITGQTLHVNGGLVMI